MLNYGRDIDGKEGSPRDVNCYFGKRPEIRRVLPGFKIQLRCDIPSHFKVRIENDFAELSIVLHLKAKPSEQKPYAKLGG